MKKNQKRKYIDFKCTECGFEKKVRADNQNKTTLCISCINKASRTPNSIKKTNKRLYYCWQNMKQRCNREGASGYEKYGGKGITVCKEWNESFRSFYEWAIKNGYKENLTIDRRDSSKGYYPKNCRWITLQDNSRTCTRDRYGIHKGIKMSEDEVSEMLKFNRDGVPSKELAIKYNVSYSLIRKLINNSSMFLSER